MRKAPRSNDNQKRRSQYQNHDEAVIIKNRAIEESNWDYEIKRAQGMRAAGRGNHRKNNQPSGNKASLSTGTDSSIHRSPRNNGQTSAAGTNKSYGNNAFDRELFDYHPAIPQRGATALTSELASLGMDTGLGQSSLHKIKRSKGNDKEIDKKCPKGNSRHGTLKMTLRLCLKLQGKLGATKADGDS